jgi:hypothetical protein
MPMTTKRRLTFKVGDRVTFLIGRRKLSGRIVEDRGRVGRDGRRLFAIRAKLDDTEESVFELPAEELRVAHNAA